MARDESSLLGYADHRATMDFGFQDLAKFHATAPPEPVLWRDIGDDDNEVSREPVVSVGEPGLLSGAGAIGKTWLALWVALAAVKAMADGDRSGATCGIRVRAGPVAYMSYETGPARLYQRAKRAGVVPEGVYISTNAQPVAHVLRRSGTISSAGFAALSEQLATLEPSLLILDTGVDALAGVGDTDTEPVRLFVRRLASLSQEVGCGVLMVCHDSKTARDLSSRLFDPGSGAVAGSRSWYDRSRGVLYLVRGARREMAVLGCLKANEGPDHWGAVLEPESRGPDGGFRGWRLGAGFAPGRLLETYQSLRVARDVDVPFVNGDGVVETAGKIGTRHV